MTKNDIKDKAFYALNLNDKFTKLCIQNAREKIAEIEIRLEKFKPVYDEKRIFYEQVKNEFLEVQLEYESINELIKDQNCIINAFTGFGSVTSQNKKLARTIDKADVPMGTLKPMQVSWLQEAVKVFTKENKFLSTSELWSYFEKNDNLVEACNKNMTKFKEMKGIALDGLIKHCLMAEKRKHGKQKLAIYNDKIGLYDWTGDDGVPTDPAHLKDFMYGNDIAHYTYDPKVTKIMGFQGLQRTGTN